jgi:uncharacterized protein (TIGR02246 family)
MRIKVPMLVVALVALASVGQSQTVSTAETQKLANDYEAAWNRNDGTALAALYDENAMSLDTEGLVIGRAALEQQFVRNFAGPLKGTKLTIKQGKLQSLTPDILIGEGLYTIMGVVGPDGKPMPPVEGRYLNTFVRKGGAWIIVLSTGIDKPPAPHGGA